MAFTFTDELDLFPRKEEDPTSQRIKENFAEFGIYNRMDVSFQLISQTMHFPLLDYNLFSQNYSKVQYLNCFSINLFYNTIFILF